MTATPRKKKSAPSQGTVNETAAKLHNHFIPRMRPETALEAIITLERSSMTASVHGRCVWCLAEAVADDAHYLAPFPHMLEGESEVYFAACCQEHADEYIKLYAALSEAVLKRDPEVQP